MSASFVYYGGWTPGIGRDRWYPIGRDFVAALIFEYRGPVTRGHRDGFSSIFRETRRFRPVNYATDERRVRPPILREHARTPPSLPPRDNKLRVYDFTRVVAVFGYAASACLCINICVYVHTDTVDNHARTATTNTFRGTPWYNRKNVPVIG